jgi:hypothetical protein
MLYTATSAQGANTRKDFVTCNLVQSKSAEDSKLKLAWRLGVHKAVLTIYVGVVLTGLTRAYNQKMILK